MRRRFQMSCSECCPAVALAAAMPKLAPPLPTEEAEAEPAAEVEAALPLLLPGPGICGMAEEL